MKKFSTSVPLLAGTIAALVSLAFTPRAHGFGGPPGGPFSNGSYFPNEGTFSAVVRGENLTGTVQFSTTSGSGGATTTDAGPGSTGVSTIYFDGDTYMGNSQGAYNPQASTMNVNFQGAVQGQGEQTYVSSSGSLKSEVHYFDSQSLDGYADCKASNAFPNQKFSGKGFASMKKLEFGGFSPVVNNTDYRNMPISISGVRLSNVASVFTSKEVRPPSVSEVITLTP